MKNAIFLLCCTSCLLLFQGCRKKDRLEAQDVCAGTLPFEIKIIADEFPGDSITVETDSILVNRHIALLAVYPDKGYHPTFEWQIDGMEIQQTGAELFLSFQTPNVQAGDEIDITLTVTVPPNLCNKVYQGRDTIKQVVKKKVTVIAWKDAAIIGKFKGLFDQDRTRKDTQVVEVKFFPPDNIYTDGHFSVFNVQKGCNQIISNPNNSYWYNISGSAFAASKSMAFFASSSFYNGCLGPSAWLKLSPSNRDSLIVDYYYSPSIDNWETKIKDRFIGKRIL